MNKIKNITKKVILKHLIAWVLVGIFLFIADPVIGPISAQFIGMSLILSNYMIVYYFLNLFVFERFLKNRYLHFITCILMSYFIFISVFFGIINYAIPVLGGKNPHYPFIALMINLLLLYSFLFFSALGNYQNRLGTQKLKIQYEKEKALITKELYFLKNQFNSHITFNFLNFCYSHVHQSSEGAAEAIVLFSDMLRYSLKIKPDENVPLQKEIDYIENFINLQSLLSSKVCINFNYDGLIEGKLILPRILITFVENAFKHGIFNDPTCPININLLANSDHITFSVNNKKNYKEKVTDSGIGQQNVKLMLDFFYQQNYELSIRENTTDYSCELILKI